MNSKRTIWTAATLLGLVAIFALPAAADQQILDDLIVDGSACVGQDCVNGESFGFDTLRLKENNLRIKFQDTSTSASFPTFDWTLIANDSSNGGRNRFTIECTELGRESFTIEGCAPSNSLYVDDGGRIGFGTANPVVQLHVVDGNTPTLRLEQDGSSGFTAQTWDLAGNEANFFIRDATNGSTLPFRIQPGAPTDTVYIDGDGSVGIGAGTNPGGTFEVGAEGNVGFGTDAFGDPGDELHIYKSSGNSRILLETAAASQVAVRLVNSGGEWRFQNAGSGEFTIEKIGAAVSDQLVLTDTGDMTIAGGLVTGTAGSCESGTPCDGVFDPEIYTVEPIKEHAAYMWENQHLPGVGPTRAGDPINITRKTTGMLHALEKAHIYIEQLHDRLAEVEAKLETLQSEGDE